ncbi:ectonucleoside triphosphate diphosphohydrolase 8 [Rhinolophus ferrumequinum]|uniref:Ectonucleoside triphosphate diphosphohydrolase 8 n=1 Tax=Rhinolophus ferrumequinum TaxID=59479 RepID=A0A671EGZ1_RHIFE|nr:ectonucleoside triphosphate diphosphohydrolase 8 [Rhinolophus ferrumequinum]XP_032978808.1 ectonucleoside triphosphate diphosphohydrolase 8 [Rhinolophus ferrumequinum]XP_032978809.1 ectonucleoside triphosphate diphosphohydrolase 8 [Rhinolophus ferrumequinum]XP_032978810.1 ectonucleoside triphosphate diphosphohydrolase 8 [Rhinolophus ferrumequinum]XP_032978811.1 ectonucleoside triphosphate diphosphohydrolase 8 [Rhinolophus ferrumequinum]KAF6269209.1 ectonucleoside triphosphate diphosphohydro
MRLTWKERVMTALLGAAVASGITTLILILVEATNVFLPTDIKFGIVFDAGSSHTSLFVYRWPADKENDTGVVSQALACRAKGPGISSYASSPDQAGESLQGCLEEALKLIPEAQHQGTPMFLGATAGMRLLSQKNSSQAADIFAAVTRVLRQAPVDLWGAELLAGQDEGALGWITINYVLGLLVKYSFSGEWIRPPEGTLVGALDMGGASTQITFVPGVPILDKSTEATFRLYGFEHQVYTHSYLCFGRDQMLLRLLAGLVQSSPVPRVRHPCYHSGYQGTLSLASVFETPCVHATAPPGLPQNLTVEGTGNPGACVSAIRDLFNFSSCEGRDNCAFSGVYQPPVRGPFYAFSNFYYTFHFLNLTSGQPLATANTTVWEFCQKHWKLVETAWPGQERWLRDYCASGLYILTLLVHGYGFSEETWSSIEFRKQAGGTDIGWTLGYMLNLTSMIPAELPAQWRAQSYSVWAVSIVFMVVTLVAVLAVAVAQLLWPHD